MSDIGHEIVVIGSHDVELIDLLVDESFLHIEVLQIIDLPLLDVILHASDCQLFLLSSEGRNELLVLGLYAIHQPRYSKLELPDARVDDVEGIAGVIIGIHLELDEAGGD